MDRRNMLARLAEQTWDLLVIGGGISGAGVARAAALRGLRVALVEQGDFGSGTSSRSGKMIVGGLRYLMNREFRLVREGLREREHLQRMAPHLVYPVPFLIPVWAGDPDPLWKIRLGLRLYDALVRIPRHRRHRRLDAPAILALEPGLREDGLVGGAQYWDCMTDDSRLTLETVQSAAQAGAAVANYARVRALRRQNGRVSSVAVEDVLGGERIDVSARVVMTAAGPWSDELRRLDAPGAPPRLRLVQGTFIVVPRERLPVSRVVTIRATDQRMVFAVPIRGRTYLGTTELDYAGDPGNVAPTAAEVAYLLQAAARHFPAAGITGADVISAWAGIRPLVGARPGQSASQVTRDYALLTSPGGLVTLAGGKLTGFRAMGEHVVDQLFPTTRGTARAASTGRLPGAAGSQPGPADLDRWAGTTGVSTGWLRERLGWYGSSLAAVAAELPAELPAGLPAGLPAEDGAGRAEPRRAWLLAQARHAVKRELAQRLTDVLWRRTGVMVYEPEVSHGAAQAVAREMAALLGWSPGREAAELELYRYEVSRMQAWRKG